MSDDAVRWFDRLGLTLLAVHIAIVVGLAVCWVGASQVDRSDRLLAILALVAASLYLLIGSLVAGVVYDSVQSRLANRFYTVAGIAGLLAFVAPAIVQLLP